MLSSHPIWLSTCNEVAPPNVKGGLKVFKQKLDPAEMLAKIFCLKRMNSKRDGTNGTEGGQPCESICSISGSFDGRNYGKHRGNEYKKQTMLLVW